jgi:hypothetical protein
VDEIFQRPPAYAAGPAGKKSFFQGIVLIQVLCRDLMSQKCSLLRLSQKWIPNSFNKLIETVNTSNQKEIEL